MCMSSTKFEKKSLKKEMKFVLNHNMRIVNLNMGSVNHNMRSVGIVNGFCSLGLWFVSESVENKWNAFLKFAFSMIYST